jgi:enolase
MASIEAVGAREILDSRGNPTVEVEVALDDGTIARAAVPSGASTGKFEAVELRDGGERYGGKGVQKAVTGIMDEIGPSCWASTPTSSGSSTRRCSTSTAPPTRPGSAPTRSSACRWRWPVPPPTRRHLPLFRYVGGPNAHVLPVPMMNILNGGAHADTAVDVQEFMVAPIGAPTFSEALMQGTEVYHALKSVLKKRGLATGLGDEGGFAPDLPSNRDALDLIAEAVQNTGSRSARTSPWPWTWRIGVPR